MVCQQELLFCCSVRYACDCDRTILRETGMAAPVIGRRCRGPVNVPAVPLERSLLPHSISPGEKWEREDLGSCEQAEAVCEVDGEAGSLLRWLHWLAG